MEEIDMCVDTQQCFQQKLNGMIIGEIMPFYPQTNYRESINFSLLNDFVYYLKDDNV